MKATVTDCDVLIVGAGISGIGMAAHLTMKCPDHTYAIVERRENIGGTWDLFRYPGIRSDSDMHTLSYEFEPWTGRETLASADRIREYLAGVTRKYDIERHVRFGTSVVAASFDSGKGFWTVTVEDAGGRHEIKARWLYLAAGYYDYDHPHDPAFLDEDTFAGRIVHAQHWPEDLEYAGKRVAVIGSGATAVTLVPNMARDAARVYMVQRSPTYIRSIPGHDKIAHFFRRFMPASTAFRITRWLHIWGADKMYRRARSKPEEVRAELAAQTRELLGDNYREADHTPSYAPWDQRLCFIPDADLFEAVNQGKVEIVTGHIARLTPTGIVMRDGREVSVDVIVKATGLTLKVAGGIPIEVDGKPFVPKDHFYYKSSMISDMPNLVHPVPYINTGSTLRFDLISEYICRVLRHMSRVGATVATPRIPADAELEPISSYAVEAGYVKRAADSMPLSTVSDPWRLSHDYLHDRKYMHRDPIDDGLLEFARPDEARETKEALLDAAE